MRKGEGYSAGNRGGKVEAARSGQRTGLGDRGSQVRVLSPELLPRVTITSDLPDTSALLLAASRMLDGQVAAVHVTDLALP